MKAFSAWTEGPYPPATSGASQRSRGERPMRSGWYGVVQAAELLPLLFNHANRPAFLGHRAGGHRTIALPDAPEPMPPGGEG